MTRLLFPSGDVTPAKRLWLLLGLGLAAVHLRDALDSCRRRFATVGRQLVLVDDANSQWTLVDDQPRQVEVETQLFEGQVRLVAGRGAFEVQAQGRVTRSAPPHSKLFLALELLQTPVWDVHWAAKALLEVVHKLCRSRGVHLSCGEDGELPHVAVPMQALEFSGDKRRVNSLAVGKMYTLEARIVDWRWRYLATAMLAAVKWAPLRWMKMPDVQLAAYLVTPPPKRDQKQVTAPHSVAHKHHLFSFSVRHQDQEQLQVETQRLHISLPRDDQVPDFDVGSPIALWGGKGGRGGVPLAHVEACRRIADNSRALGRLSFSLDVWVEFVDRVAGRRKVGYLLEVVDMQQQFRRTVMRSATTIKNALLLLRLEHQLDRKETERETGIAADEDQDETQVEEPVDFQRLTVESREYRYEQIEHETAAVSHVLEHVASKPCQGRRRWRQPQRCYQNQLEKATLYKCLMSPSRLPAVPSYHAIGVQINEAQHLAMNVVCEAGIYRLHGAGDGTTPLLRQEWFIVSADHLHFFRSFSVSPSLSVPVTNVLNVCSVDHVRLLNGNKPVSAHHERGAVPRWYCVEIHLVLEVITLFVETPEERDRLVASLQPLTIDDCDLNVQSIAVKGARTEAVAASPLFSPMTLNSQSQPVCLNQRTSRFVNTTSAELDSAATLSLVQEGLEAGLKVFALGEAGVRLRINRPTVLGFLNKVERLNELDLDKVESDMSSEDRFALGLNLYHTLFIHAVLIFGHPQSHEQWKLLQTVPCYLVRINGGLESVRFTLADIQRVMLRCPVPVTLEASSIKRSLSQNSLMDLAIGGGDAINGLCRTMLGVAWTPVFPSSSSFSVIKKTPLPIPAGLAIDSADMRTSLVLQINSSPPIDKTTGIIRVYDGSQKLNEQLNAACTAFLSRELRLGEVNRVIYLPRVCEWYRIGHDEDVDDQIDGVSRRMGPLSQRRRRRSSSGSVTGLAALPKSRGFYCLQRLLDFMEVEQHHRVMHLLLGAGEECRFVFDDFWTRPTRSAAASLLSSAGSAALAVFTGSGVSTAADSAQTPKKSGARGRSESDWCIVGQRSYF
ncbi:Pleckstrin homology-like domain [Phytophthora cinnamomi]|uniref:Pleckstrin homology-like domain n=1 Tax=Phytophthora cinnamomi TaxID=4785 RepID=UPI00355A6CF4|nr:Pleckstrin homology-like domain [Phytophthora cinnamomi]